MTIFCFVCKQHVDLGHVETDEQRADALRRFRACCHDDRKVRQLRRGPIGYYMRDVDDEPTHEIVVLGDPNASEAPREIAECFENEKRIAA